jgi:hypothetical protein
MIRRYLLASPLVLACLFSSPVLHASVASSFTPDHAMFAKSVKTVKLVLRNTSSSPIELRAGEKIITVDAGKTATVELPAGTRITTNAATSKHPAGTVLIEVYSALNGATIDLS